MDFSKIVVRYAPVATDGENATDTAPAQPHEISFSGSSFVEDGSVAVGVARTAETIEVTVQALAPIRLCAVEVTLSDEFSPTEQVLLNGYQSWTDTAWRPAWDVMRGLDHVPGPIVRKYVLDGGGDYRFCDYSDVRGRMHGWTYAALRKGEDLALVASLSEDAGFTLIRTDADAGTITLCAECPARVLRPGEEAPGGCYAVLEGPAADEGALYDRWFELAGIASRPARPLVGYTSWYRRYAEIDDVNLAHDLAGARNVLGAVNAPGCDRVFQVDDGWCKVGDWLQPDQAKFPAGMDALAARIREAGLTPGLWAAPFVYERESALFEDRPDWLLRDGAGKPVPTGCHWSGAFALDTLNPEVRAYVRECLGTMARGWGFGLLKLDFLYAACMLPHGGLNRGQLMADAMNLLREAVGEDALILACGVPLGAAFGRADYCRIGCDVGPSWDDAPHMRLLHRERVSTRNSLANTLARAPLDGRAFGCDPDVFYLRDDVKLSPGQRARLLRSDAQCGSVFFTSDDMGAWSERERGRYQSALDTLVTRKGGGARLAGASGESAPESRPA